MNEIYTVEKDGGSALADLLLSRSTICPLVADVQRNDLVATAIWYAWWE